jgi:hypothetical protein
MLFCAIARVSTLPTPSVIARPATDRQNPAQVLVSSKFAQIRLRSLPALEVSTTVQAFFLQTQGVGTRARFDHSAGGRAAV